MYRFRVARLLVCLMLSLSAACLIAQNTNSGNLRGSVTDSTGAVVPGATVTVVDLDKGVTRTLTTNDAGLYDTGSIVPDHYQLTFSANGFQTLERGPLTVIVGVTTLDAQLSVGSSQQKVTVTADVPLLQTESGEQAHMLEAETMSKLPQMGQDWQNFVILQPGVSGAPSQPNGVLNAGQVSSANGNLPYSTVLADGANTTLPMSQNADVSTFENISEVKISASSFSAEYGVGGIIYNQISKGGTNQFHGTAYEYFQNDAMNAASYVFRAHKTREQAVAFLRYNNFGGSIGGPVLRNRMFFYFNVDWTLNHPANTGTMTVPTDAMRQGDFTGQNPIYDPTTQTIDSAGVVHRSSFAAEYGSNRVPASMIDTVARAIQTYYPEPNTTGTIANGQVQNNYFYNVQNDVPFHKFFGRLDYDITKTNRLTLSDNQNDRPGTYRNQGLCPIYCYYGGVDSNNAQISDVWTISPTLFNEARMSSASEMDFFVPQTLNAGYPAKMGLALAKADIFPIINISGACCYTLQPGAAWYYKQFSFDPSDVVTWDHGRHVFRFGAEILINRADSTIYNHIISAQLGYTGVYTASTQGAGNTSGVAYADFLLGKTASWNATVTPEYGARFKSPQFFVQDDFKVSSKLTLNLGVRWQIQRGWSEVKGNIRTFDPNIMNPATNTPGAMWYQSTAVNGRDRLQGNVYSTVLPRVGFAYQLFPDTVVRGGFGLFGYTWSEDTYGNGIGGALGSTGSISDQTNGATPVTQLSSNGSSLPYIAATTNPAGYNGQAVSYNQYQTPVAKIYQWNLALQRQVAGNMMFDLAYVGSHGLDLPFQTDINQVPQNLLAPNDSVSRPYPIYQAISGSTNNAISNYSSLQLQVQKRMSRGFSFNANYTWSHFLDEMDSSGWGSRGGTQTYQNAHRPGANYGPSNFDIRHMFKGSAIYELPFGRDRLFLNHNGLLDAALGGWQASGTFVVQTGNPFTPVMSSSTASYALAGSWFPNQTGNPAAASRSIDQWFNTSAYAQPTPGTFGSVHRNSLYGPGLSLISFSLGKTFSLVENVKFQVRADAVNIVNHPSWGTPDNSIGPGHNGVISTTTVGGRTMQLVAHLTF